MAQNARIEQLLEEMLSSGRTPEEVAGDSPALLEELRERWNHLRRIEAQLQTLFPPSDKVPSDSKLINDPAALADIPGYDVTEILGRGGMGIVYRGVHRKLNRAVAIKMLLANRFATSTEREMLAREAQAIAALRHPNIVQVFDVGEADGCPYFTMEHMDGGTLAQRLEDGPLPVRDVIAAIVTLARAVEAAHQQGIVHRDLKPANVLLTSDGTPKVSDFGLARRADANDQNISLMQTGMRIGTPSYMAPEQALGERNSVGPISDVYALGAILYEMLTGRPPFLGESPADTERQLLAQDPVAPSRLNSRVPRDLETICLKCLEKSPARRYRSAAELADDVERFERNEPIAARRASLLERAIKLARRHPGASVALVASTILLVSLVAAGTWFISSRAANARAADADLVEAETFLRRSEWSAADRAIDRATLRLEQGGALPLRERLDQARRDSALAAKLDAIRMRDPGTVTKAEVTFQRAADEYKQALSNAGIIDVAQIPADAARRIGESNIRDTLVIAVDAWALANEDKNLRDWLRDVRRQISPDATGWRDRALDLDTYKDPDKRRALMADAPISRESLQLLHDVGRKMKDSGEDVIPFFTRIHDAFPGDFWANEHLAAALYDAGRFAEAIPYERAAIAIRPDLGWLRFNLAGAMLHSGDLPGATPHFERAVEMVPDHVGARAYLAYAYLNTERPNDALRVLDEAIRLHPKETVFLSYRGDAYRALMRDDDALAAYSEALAIDPNDAAAITGTRTVLLRSGKFEQAIDMWQQGMKDRPADHAAWDGFAEYRLFVRDTEGYSRMRSELLSRFGDSKDAGVCERTGRTCLLTPPSSDDELRRATELIDRAMSAGKGSPAMPYYQVAKALAEYRAGKCEAALSSLRGNSMKVLQPMPQLIEAMARHRLGQVSESRATLASAIAMFDWSDERVHRDIDYREVWMYHILRREAEALINPSR